MYHVWFPRLNLKFLIDPVAFRIGDFEIYWYGIIVAAAFLSAVVYAFLNAKRFKIPKDSLIDCIIVGVILGVIGARLFYVIFYPGDFYIKNPMHILYIHEGGLAIYGGLVGGLLGGCLMARYKKMDILPMLDLAAIGFLLAQSIGRWGNFVNQEAFGIATHLPWGMISENTLQETLYTVHPCFLYESIWCIIGFFILDFISRKYKKYDGQIILCYMVWYGFGRFLIEGLRTDSLITLIFGLRVSQLISAIIFIVGLTILLIKRWDIKINDKNIILEGRAMLEKIRQFFVNLFGGSKGEKTEEVLKQSELQSEAKGKASSSKEEAAEKDLEIASVKEKKEISTKKETEKTDAKNDTQEKKTSVKKPAAKKTTAKKETGEKKTPAKKTTTKKVDAKKDAEGKTTTKKPATKKVSTTKDTEEKKATVKKPAAKKTTAKKDAEEKTTTTKKTTTKKTTTKKPAAKKTTAKKETGEKKTPAKKTTTKKVDAEKDAGEKKTAAKKTTTKKTTTAEDTKKKLSENKAETSSDNNGDSDKK